ncbi:MAG: hypothetical protein RIS84_1885 [Pseudomonadota bacterium]|jgi:hypothetical protein
MGKFTTILYFVKKTVFTEAPNPEESPKVALKKAPNPLKGAKPKRLYL